MNTSSTPEGPDFQDAAARLFCGVLSLIYLVALALPWAEPATGADEGETYSGWGLLGTGLGGSSAEHVCGEKSCGGMQQLLIAALPTLAVLLAAAALLTLMRHPGVVRARVALGLNLLVLVALVLEVFSVVAAANENDSDDSNLRSGLLVVLVLAVSACFAVAAVRTGLDRRARPNPAAR